MPQQLVVVVVVLVMSLLCVLRSVEANNRPDDDRNDDVAGSLYTIRKSDRLEAIKRYILQRLNVSEHRRFNHSTSAVPSSFRTTTVPTQNKQPATQTPTHHRRQQTSFSSLPEALNFYAERMKEDGRRRRGGGGQARQSMSRGNAEVQRRRRRLHAVDAAGTELRKRGASRPRAHHRKRRRQVKLTMTADTGQITFAVRGCPEMMSRDFRKKYP